MNKLLRDSIDLNGGFLISVDSGNIVTRVYQSVFFTKYCEKDLVKIQTAEAPFSSGDLKVSLASDILELSNKTLKIDSFNNEFIKSIFIWILEQAIPYFAKIAKELETEIIISNALDIETGNFESYASLGDDLPVLLISITNHT
jgi:hypothetical protein